MSICKIEEREAGRSWAHTCPTCRFGPCSRGHDYKSMREQIDTQAAEIERLTRERDEAMNLGPLFFKAEARATAAEAEAERLRDALRSIEGMVNEATTAPMTASRWLDRIEDRARDALERKP